ncbi:transposase family protein, partial [Streptomyces sundarbansensis]
RFFLRPTFVNSLTQWKTRNYNDDMLFDIYDGRVWQEFGADNGRRPFVQQSDFNIMLTINIDWFQPFVGTQHSSGGVYITIQNLPRAERNQKKNVICAAILPGPKEPKTTEINSYLAPLVDELQMLFQGVFMDVVVDGVVQRKKVRAAVTLVACDLPAARKLCGFTSPSSNCACHKCQNQFGSLMTDRHRRNFTNFDVSTWIPRTLENHRRNALFKSDRSHVVL